jgi:magnesium transporter
VQAFCYKKGATKVEEGFTRDELTKLLDDKSNVVWVDLRGETPEQVQEANEVMLDVFGFHPLTVADCLITRRQPKVEAFENYLYFIVHAVKPGETTATNFATKELDGFLGDNFVVTFHVQRFLTIKRIKDQLRSSTFIMERGAAYLAHNILDEIVDLYMPVIDDYDRAISQLEERVVAMTRSNNDMLGQIMDLRRSVARLRRISARQLVVLYRISHGEFPQVPDSLLPFFRDVHDHLLRISDLSETYRDLVTGLFDIHLAVVGNRTNEIMKTLAVVSAIILPLTLIAGIYGMNFENMPEIRSVYGYFITLGVMALITLLLLLYFWRRGWIFQPEDDVPIEQVAKVEADYDDD